MRNNRHPRRAAPTVPLFRGGDLELLLVHPAINFEQAKATPKGRPSLLAKLTPHTPVDADATVSRGPLTKAYESTVALSSTTVKPPSAVSRTGALW
ncbi:hypothetical protein [Streptomyces sp. NPDC051214]|uniref:hypothetical protein n=1 Tax=Streptomyces sp. NPDC051214 TaxID=3155282 RepID=UPI003442BFEF